MLFGGYFGFQFVGTLYLQAMNGWSAIETALAFLPAGLLVAFGATRLGPVVDRFGTARIIAVGAVSLLAGYLLFLRVDAHAGLRRADAADDAVARRRLRARRSRR